ncbi:mucin-5AC-like [Bombina bombina]|uniref:mucin-5AC-like n=1 Tax=Bombina bombina TaxID=8345 RepID=UPI00235AF235|nr:mucin-5AC-like [Bombina bombina]
MNECFVNIYSKLIIFPLFDYTGQPLQTAEESWDSVDQEYDDLDLDDYDYEQQSYEDEQETEDTEQKSDQKEPSVVNFISPTHAPVFRDRYPSHNKRICSTWGNSHFKTFDGEIFHFPGKCNYLLASNCKNNFEEFNIQLRRTEKRGNTLTISSIKIRLEGADIELAENIVTVNNIPLYHPRIENLPYSYSGIQISKTGTYVRIVSKIGIEMIWNEDDSIMLELSPKFANQTCGICGDFNGIPTYNEFMINDVKMTDLQYGNFHKVNGPKEHCEDITEIPQDECPTHPQRHLCQAILTSPAFQYCNDLVNVSRYIESCEQDLCRCTGNSTGFCLCNIFTEYSRQCTHAGGKPKNWRTAKLCPLRCAFNLEFRECGTACQDTCTNPERSLVCDDHCTDGCFCPSGTVFDDIGRTGCIPKEKCSCTFNGETYASGSGYSETCKTCTCNGGKWSCASKACHATCALEGGSHITTFDLSRYNFHGDCSYTLAKSSNSQLFSILAELRKCGITDTETCLKSITLSLNGGKDIILVKHCGSVYTNSVYTNLPVSSAAATIFKPTSFFIIIDTKVGIQVKAQLVPNMQIYIRADPSLMDTTYGLCGNFNNIQSDDFLAPSGVIEGSGSSFGNLWKSQADCPNVRSSLEDPCALSIDNEKFATHWCSMLLDAEGPFAGCHKTVEPSEFHKNCLFDSCNCAESEECMCTALSSYVHACSEKGIDLRGWRKNVCNIYTTTCPASFTYSYLVSTCQPTCRSLSEPDSNCGIDFTPIDGCICEDGKYLDENGKCVLPALCSCYYKGTPVGPEEMIHDNGAVCTCRNGILECIGEVKKPECDYPMVYLECSNATDNAKGSECQKSCSTFDMECYSTQCVSGCMCPEGLVANGEGDCIREEDCPCKHNDDDYEPGDTIRVQCNTCTCKHRKWECTSNTCLGSCAVYGDGHYITFDSNKYHFNGDCEYTLAQDYCSGDTSDGSFRVITENIPCGTTGTTCSKAIKLFLGNFELILGDQKFEVVKRETGQYVPFKVRQMGLYMVIEAVNGVVLVWDKKTSIFIKLHPQFQGKTCGLCGNYDGNAVNDFSTRSKSVVGDVFEFGNSWKLSPSCPDALAIRDPCSSNPYRKAWSQRQCSIITSATFFGCHSLVDPVKYYDSCVNDACACDTGGDCECFCTAVASYAQACSEAGQCINWRTPTICPVFCDFYNRDNECEWHYKPCGAPCMKTCMNPTGVCYNNLPGLAGCYPNCPVDRPYFDEQSMSCVSSCLCYDKYGDEYKPGQKMPGENKCSVCYCTKNGMECTKESACCYYDNKEFLPGDVIYTTGDDIGGCLTAICKDNLTIERISGPCTTTVRPSTSFHFTTSPSTPSSGSTDSSTVSTSTESPGSSTRYPSSTTASSTSSPGSTQTVTPTTCVEAYDCKWSEWYDVDKPEMGNGDYETLDNIRAKGYDICRKPANVQCRAKEFPDESIEDLKDEITCNKKDGLICLNSKNSPICHNFEIRIECCKYRECGTTSKEPSTPGSTKTLPPSSSEYTTQSTSATSSTTGAPPSGKPSTSQTTTSSSTQVTDGSLSTPKSTSSEGHPTSPIPQTSELTTSQQILPTSIPQTSATTSLPTTGCIMKMECRWTPWYDNNAPSTKSDGGDDESSNDVKSAGKTVCTNREVENKIECEGIDDNSLPITNNQQKFTCNLDNGLICRNRDQKSKEKCYNYRMRIECCAEYCEPTETPFPVTTESTTSQGVPTSSTSQITETTTSQAVPSSSIPQTTELTTLQGVTPSSISQSTESTSSQGVPTKSTPQTSDTTSIPTSGCVKKMECRWTTWYDTNAPSPKSDGGDTENPNTIKSTGIKICSNQEVENKIECEAINNNGLPIFDNKQIVTCNLKDGLSCKNRDQQKKEKCYNYRMRIECCAEHCEPTGSPIPGSTKSTTEGEITSTRFSPSTEVTAILSTTSVTETSTPDSKTSPPETKTTPSTGTSTSKIPGTESSETPSEPSSTTSTSGTTTTTSSSESPQPSTSSSSIEVTGVPSTTSVTETSTPESKTSPPGTKTTPSTGTSTSEIPGTESSQTSSEPGSITSTSGTTTTTSSSESPPSTPRGTSSPLSTSSTTTIGSTSATTTSTGVTASESPSTTKNCEQFRRAECHWSDWFNEEVPSEGEDGGDIENTDKLKAKGIEVCKQDEVENQIECKAVQYPELAYEQIGQVSECNLKQGLVCQNSEQTGDVKECHDYKIRIECCSKNFVKHCGEITASTTSSTEVTGVPSTTSVTETSTPESKTSPPGTKTTPSTGTSTSEIPSTESSQTSSEPGSTTSTSGTTTTTSSSESPQPSTSSSSIEVTGVPSTTSVTETSTPESKTSPPGTKTTPSTGTSTSEIPGTESSQTSSEPGSTTSTSGTTTTTSSSESPPSTPRGTSSQLSTSSTTTIGSTSTTTTSTGVTASESPSTTKNCEQFRQAECHWSDWFNEEVPSEGEDGGDIENTDKLKAKGIEVCKQDEVENQIECKAVQYPELAYEQIGQVSECNLKQGLVCQNSEQTGGVKECHDYKIRIECCSKNFVKHCGEITVPTISSSSTEVTGVPSTTSVTETSTPESKTSPPGTKTTPSTGTSTGEIPGTESSQSSSEPGSTTSTSGTTTTTSSSESPPSTPRGTSSPLSTSSTTTIGSTSTTTTSTGVTASESPSTTKNCEQFRQAECHWSDWFNEEVPSKGEDGGDIENTDKLKAKGIEVCKQDEVENQIECKAVQYPELAYEQIGQVSECNLKQGLVCQNSEQTGDVKECHDYKIRIECCSKNFVKHCGEITASTTSSTEVTGVPSTTSVTETSTPESKTSPPGTKTSPSTGTSTGEIPGTESSQSSSEPGSTTSTSGTTTTTSSSESPPSTPRGTSSPLSTSSTTTIGSTSTTTTSTGVTASESPSTTKNCEQFRQAECHWSDWFNEEVPSKGEDGGDIENTDKLKAKGIEVCKQDEVENQIECKAVQYPELAYEQIGQVSECNLKQGLVCQNSEQTGDVKECHDYKIRIECCSKNFVKHCGEITASTTSSTEVTGVPSTTSVTETSTPESKTSPPGTKTSPSTGTSTSEIPGTESSQTSSEPGSTTSTSGTTTTTSSSESPPSTPRGTSSPLSTSSTTTIGSTSTTTTSIGVTASESPSTTKNCEQFRQAECHWSDWFNEEVPSEGEDGGDIENTDKLKAKGIEVCKQEEVENQIECKAVQYPELAYEQIGQVSECNLKQGLVCQNSEQTGDVKECHDYKIRIECCSKNFVKHCGVITVPTTSSSSTEVTGVPSTTSVTETSTPESKTSPPGTKTTPSTGTSASEIPGTESSQTSSEPGSTTSTSGTTTTTSSSESPPSTPRGTSSPLSTSSTTTIGSTSATTTSTGVTASESPSTTKNCEQFRQAECHWSDWFNEEVPSEGEDGGDIENTDKLKAKGIEVCKQDEVENQIECKAVQYPELAYEQIGQVSECNLKQGLVCQNSEQTGDVKECHDYKIRIECCSKNFVKHCGEITASTTSSTEVTGVPSTTSVTETSTPESKTSPPGTKTTPSTGTSTSEIPGTESSQTSSEPGSTTSTSGTTTTTSSSESPPSTPRGTSSPLSTSSTTTIGSTSATTTSTGVTASESPSTTKNCEQFRQAECHWSDWFNEEVPSEGEDGGDIENTDKLKAKGIEVCKQDEVENQIECKAVQYPELAYEQIGQVSECNLKQGLVCQNSEQTGDVKECHDYKIRIECCSKNFVKHCGEITASTTSSTEVTGVPSTTSVTETSTPESKTSPPGTKTTPSTGTSTSEIPGTESSQTSSEPGSTTSTSGTTTTSSSSESPPSTPRGTSSPLSTSSTTTIGSTSTTTTSTGVTASESPSTTKNCEQFRQAECHWSDWFNEEVPSKGEDGGDIENTDKLKAKGIEVCKQDEIENQIECKAVQYPELAYEQIGQVSECNLKQGLVCQNSEQTGDVKECHDYKIRIECCSKNFVKHCGEITASTTSSTEVTGVPSTTSVTETSTPESKTSPPGTKTTPSTGTSTSEIPGTESSQTSSEPGSTTSTSGTTTTTSSSESPPSTPRGTSSPLSTSSTTTIGSTSTTTTSTGVTASESPSTTTNCEHFRQAECHWSDWFNEEVASKGEDGGDIENTDKLKAKGIEVCKQDEVENQIECKAVQYPELAYEQIGQVSECNLKQGLVCQNSEQTGDVKECHDYKIRIECCSKNFVKHCGEITVPTTSSSSTEVTRVPSTTSVTETSTPESKTSPPGTKTTPSTGTSTSEIPGTESSQTSSEPGSTTSTSGTTTTTSSSESPPSTPRGTSSPLSTSSTTTIGSTSTTTTSTGVTASESPSTTKNCEQFRQAECHWSDWFNEEVASKGEDGGDIENTDKLKAKGIEVCKQDEVENQIECKAVQYPELAYEQIGQVSKCNVKEGLVCQNSEQTGDVKECHDYKIRIECCSKNFVKHCGEITVPTTSSSSTEVTGVPSTTSVTETSTPESKTSPPGTKTTPSTGTSTSKIPGTESSETPSEPGSTTSTSTTTTSSSSATPSSETSYPITTSSTSGTSSTSVVVTSSSGTTTYSTLSSSETTSLTSPTSSPTILSTTGSAGESTRSPTTVAGSHPTLTSSTTPCFCKVDDELYAPDEIIYRQKDKNGCEYYAKCGETCEIERHTGECSTTISTSPPEPVPTTSSSSEMTVTSGGSKLTLPTKSPSSPTGTEQSTPTGSSPPEPVPTTSSSSVMPVTSRGSKLTLPTKSPSSPTGTEQSTPTGSSPPEPVPTTSSSSKMPVTSGGSTLTLPTKSPSSPTGTEQSTPTGSSPPEPVPTTSPSSEMPVTSVGSKLTLPTESPSSPGDTTPSEFFPSTTTSTPLTSGQCGRCECLMPKCETGYRVVSFMRPGACCAEIKCEPDSVCVVGNDIYQRGSTIPQEENKCQKCECSQDPDENSEFYAIKCHPIVCKETCEEGFTYIKKDGECCGECVAKQCTMKGEDNKKVEFKVGETYHPEGSTCSYYECDEEDGKPILTKVKMICQELDISTCEEGTIKYDKEGCCQTCTRKTEIKVIEKPTVIENCSSRKNLTVFKEDDCEAEVELTYCGGPCMGSSTYSMESQDMAHSCSCCTELEVGLKNVELLCANGQRKTYTYKDVFRCGCSAAVCTPEDYPENIEQTQASQRS